MKRLSIIAASLLFVSLITITAASWGLPSPDGATFVYTNEGQILAIENRTFFNYVYAMRDNKATGFYRLPALSGKAEAPVLSACTDSGKIYIIRDRQDSGVWQVITENEEGRLAPASEYVYGKGDELLDFGCTGNGASLVFRNAEGGTEVFVCTDRSKGDWAPALLYAAPAVGAIEKAKYKDGTLYLLFSGGEELAVTKNGVTAVSNADALDVPELNTLLVSFTVRLGCKAPLYLLALLVLAVVFIPLLWAEFVRRKTGSLAVRSSALVVALFTIFALLMFGAFILYTAFFISAAKVSALFCHLIVPVAASIIASLVLFTQLLKRSIGSIASLSEQMSKVADGDYRVSEIAVRNDEIGDMARSLQEMTVSLSIRDYEVRNTMLSYHRFVPNGLEMLLDRASIMEVSLGDSRAITGNTAIITVCNRQSVRLVLSDDDYVSFVNRSSSLMDSAVRPHGGILLSSGYDMAGNKVFFGGDSNAGVRSGLDLLGAASENAAKGAPMPEFYMLLHNTEFLYGIAGSDENLFPYISSSELEFLGTYSEQFRSAGVRIVVTEPFLRQLDGNYTTRYIGFLSSAGFRLSFKLFEILDACSDLERNLRISYDPTLQKAINMFYKSDYYLARNLFSSVLRICPTDGIARWYLFACEHFFHAPEGEEPNFQLFGVNFD